MSTEIDQEPFIYGELIVLGYNGYGECQRKNSHGRLQRSKMELIKKSVGNGIKKATAVSVAGPPQQTNIVRDRTKHTVSYSCRQRSVIVEYNTDNSKDMFQIGRSSEDQIDFTIVDTLLATAAKNCIDDQNAKVSLITEKSDLMSTISRFACRILIDRNPPYITTIFAAGFDASKNIFLGEKATKWRKRDGEMDGLITNGILILHPDRNTDDCSQMYVWREVSVDGDIYTLRETRSDSKRGDRVQNETNQLQDGSLIDLCGATLLWRTNSGLKHSPNLTELESRLNELNAGRPQCPVNLNTLIVPRRKGQRTDVDKQPYVYLDCGHVQGKHTWGLHSQGGTSTFKCPMCLVESGQVLQLSMGMESAFHLDSGALDYAFNPCGHVASFGTVRYWSRIPLPQGTNSFHPVCPFCTTLLSAEKPDVRLIFQDHCFDD